MSADRSGHSPDLPSARTGVVVALSLVVAVVLGDSGVVTLALPEILQDFDAEVAQVAWVLTAFNLVLALVAVPAARLSMRRDPAGWCAVAPRSDYESLVRNARVPWDGRDEDRADGSIWAVTCLLTRAGFRKRGVSRALARAAVDFARARGARAIEAYPILTTDVITEELHVGTQGVFAAAGFAEVSRPTLRRIVMRIDF